MIGKYKFSLLRIIERKKDFGFYYQRKCSSIYLYIKKDMKDIILEKDQQAATRKDDKKKKETLALVLASKSHAFNPFFPFQIMKLLTNLWLLYIFTVSYYFTAFWGAPTWIYLFKTKQTPLTWPDSLVTKYAYACGTWLLTASHTPLPLMLRP